MSIAPVIATGVLAIPTLTNPSILPLTPSPPPPPQPPSDDDTDGESVASDDDDDDDDTHAVGLAPPQIEPSAASRTLNISSTYTSITSTTSKSSASAFSTARAISLSDSSTSMTESSSNSEQTTLRTSTTSQASQSRTSSKSGATGLTSTPTSTALTSTSTQSSNVTALPVGQPDSASETKAGSSPLGTAGIILAAIFGFIALLTTIYLLYRLRRRRKAQDSSTLDQEKQSNYASTTQETGVIFGRRRSSPRTTPNPYAQQDGQDQTRGHGRSRFSFLNRRWYSTGTQFSDLQQQQQDQQAQPTSTTSAPPSPPRWPSAFFFTRGLALNLRSASRTNSEYYPAATASASASASTTRLTTDIQRNISTRTTDSTTSQAGSGHARAYAHHRIRAPHSVVVNAARSTISSVSSISSRWLRQRSYGSVSPSYPQSPSTLHNGQRGGDRDSVVSPISEVSDMYNNHNHDRTSTSFPPQRHRVSGSRQNNVDGMVSRWSSSESSGEVETSKGTRGGMNFQASSKDRQRVPSMPRLPLPVVVSRGSWGGSEGARVQG